MLKSVGGCEVPRKFSGLTGRLTRLHTYDSLCFIVIEVLLAGSATLDISVSPWDLSVFVPFAQRSNRAA